MGIKGSCRVRRRRSETPFDERLVQSREVNVKQGRSLWSRLVRLAAGYVHLLVGILWFGTILYVHLILKPAYAAHGLPKGEVKVGLFSMAVMAATGGVLT